MKALKEVESFLAGRAGVDVRVQQTAPQAGQIGITSLKLAAARRQVSEKTADAFRTTRRQQEHAGGLSYGHGHDRLSRKGVDKLARREVSPVDILTA